MRAKTYQFLDDKLLKIAHFHSVVVVVVSKTVSVRACKAKGLLSLSRLSSALSRA